MTRKTSSSRRAPIRWTVSCAALIAALGATIYLAPTPRLIWNASASAPIGLWSVAPDAAIDRGDMVVARLSPYWQRLAAKRHYLPSNVPLIKRVAAISGDTICGDDDRIKVNGNVVAKRLSRDKMGRPLPIWHRCKPLRHGDVLLLMEHPASFDGRYFGPTQRKDIVGRASPLWVR